MHLEKLLEIVLNTPLEVQITVTVLMGILFILKITMTRKSSFKDYILNTKRAKKEVIKVLLKYLDAINYLNNKSLKDQEVIGIYNTETVLLGLKSIYQIELIEAQFKTIENPELIESIKLYLKDTKYILSSIYNLENYLYDKKKEAEQLVIKYNRELDRLHEIENHSDRLIDIKKTFKIEIDSYRYKVAQLDSTYKKHRVNLSTHLTNLKEKNERIQELLEQYKEKEVDAKKFYISKLVYA